MSRRRKRNRGNPRRGAVRAAVAVPSVLGRRVPQSAGHGMSGLGEVLALSFSTAAAYDGCGCSGCSRLAAHIREVAWRLALGSLAEVDLEPRWVLRVRCGRSGELAW